MSKVVELYPTLKAPQVYRFPKVTNMPSPDAMYLADLDVAIEAARALRNAAATLDRYGHRPDAEQEHINELTNMAIDFVIALSKVREDV